VRNVPCDIQQHLYCFYFCEGAGTFCFALLCFFWIDLIYFIDYADVYCQQAQKSRVSQMAKKTVSQRGMY